MIQIRENKNLMDTRVELRTWGERLWSWPWRPLRREKSTQVPSDQCYMIGDVLFCHPEKAKQIRRMLADATIKPLLEKLVPEMLDGHGETLDKLLAKPE